MSSNTRYDEHAKAYRLLLATAIIPGNTTGRIDIYGPNDQGEYDILAKVEFSDNDFAIKILQQVYEQGEQNPDGPYFLFYSKVNDMFQRWQSYSIEAVSGFKTLPDRLENIFGPIGVLF